MLVDTWILVRTTSSQLFGSFVSNSLIVWLVMNMPYHASEAGSSRLSSWGTLVRAHSFSGPWIHHL